MISITEIIIKNIFDIEKLKILDKQLQKAFTSPFIEKFKKEIIESIFSNPFIKSSECTICFSVGIIVDIKLPCRNINPKSGRPSCEGIMCITCARQILGLSIDRQVYYTVKCPTCRESSARPLTDDEGYAINIPLMRAIDNFLTYENSIFIKYFEHSLKPIECSKCNSYFDTLSDLHHHIRCDEGYIQCPESYVLCLQCKKLNKYKDLIKGICDICNACYNDSVDCDNQQHDHNILIDEWDEWAATSPGW